MIARLSTKWFAPTSSGFGLTFAGRLLAAPTLALVLAGWLQGGFAALIASLLLSAFLISAVAASLHLRGLRLGPPAPAQGAAGSLLSLDFPVKNVSRWFSSGALRIDAVKKRDGNHPASGAQRWLAPGMDARVSAGVRIAERGRMESLRVHAYSSFPLGLVRRAHHFDLPVDLLGLPRAGTLTSFELRALDALHASPERRTRPGSEEIAGLRDWRPGDSLRRVHWRRSASREGLVLSELHQSAAPPLEIWLLTDSEPGRSFERAVQIAATLLERALRTERRCSLRLGIDGEALPLAGPAALLRGQTALSLVQAQLRALDLEALVRSLDRDARTGRVALVLASGRQPFDPDRECESTTRSVRVFDADSRDLARGLHAEVEPR